MNIHFVTDEKIAETSSKGNQEKWKDGNRWYKLDQFGYEALAESAVSCFLEQSNMQVLNADRSQVIPGLYAVGNCMGQRFGNAYSCPSAGNNMGNALTTGRVAGKHAAAL